MVAGDDIAAPAAPTVVGSIELPHRVGPISFANNLVYVVNWFGPNTSGLTIVDVADPMAPVVVGVSDPLEYGINNLAIEGNVAYMVGHSRAGLLMVDVSDPTSPMEMRNVRLPRFGTAVTIVDDLAYVAVPQIGLVIVDLTNPEDGFVAGVTGAEVGFWHPRQVIYAKEHLFLAGDAGFGVVLPQCTDPVSIFFSGLTVSFALDAVQLQWQMNSAGDAGEFQVVGRQAGRQWLISDYHHDGVNFVAVDEAATWVAGESRTYALYWRQSGADWQLLATETMQRDLEVRRLGLGQIHPNPFNPHTTVSFSIDRPQMVEIAVYDLVGRRVIVLADEEFASGEHTTHWDGRDAAGKTVSSGIYLVRFVANQHLESRKVMLVR